MIAASKKTKVAIPFVWMVLVALFVLPTNPAFATEGPIDMIVSNIMDSVGGTPRLFAILSYFLGISVALSALFKLKSHVDNPNSEPLRSVVTRVFMGGALLSLPAVLEALTNAIGMTTADGTSATRPDGTNSTGIGSIFDNMVLSFQSPNQIFAVIAYMFGIGMAIWAIVEFIRTSDSPAQAPIRRPIMITLTSAALLTIPTIIAVLKDTVSYGLSVIVSTGCIVQTGGTTCVTPPASGGGLDQIMVRFMTDLYGPFMNTLNYVCWIAGIAFVFVGVFRLLKSAQDGPRGPVGMGTIGTFLAGGALMSIAQMMGVVQISLFGVGAHEVSTYAVLAQTGGMDPDMINRTNQAIQAVLLFVQIVGAVSFARGIFILRSVAEGNGQASMAAGFTHIIGGALAVNLTALVDAVQDTLGLVGIVV